MMCYSLYECPGVYLSHKETLAVHYTKETKMRHRKDLRSKDKNSY